MKWKHHGYLLAQRAVEHINSAYHTAWTFIWPLIYCVLALLRKSLNILNQQTQTFFSLFYWSYGLCITYHVFFSFSTLVHKVNEAGKWHKIDKFDHWPQFLASTRAHQVCIGICFLVVSLFIFIDTDDCCFYFWENHCIQGIGSCVTLIDIDNILEKIWK